MGSMLVWEFVAGRTLEEMAGEISSPVDLSKLAEEVLISVQSLHGLGIVHGAVHGRNIILDARRAVKLTHVSPLLYDDPRQDAHDVAAVFAGVAASRGWDPNVWEKLRAHAEDRGLNGMRARLTSASLERWALPESGRSPESRRRRRLMVGAVVSLAAGMALAGAVIGHEIRNRPPIPVPPRVAPSADQSDAANSDTPEAPGGQTP
jgi:hypothetical protein